MIKWFAYIVLLLIMTPALLSAKDKGNQYVFNNNGPSVAVYVVIIDTTSATAKNTKKQSDQDNKKVKEIGKAKRQPKPEKVEPAANASTPAKLKPKRQRRPEGLERPPEIPRRNGGG